MRPHGRVAGGWVVLLAAAVAGGPAAGGQAAPPVRERGPVIVVSDVVYATVEDDTGAPRALTLDAAFPRRAAAAGAAEGGGGPAPGTGGRGLPVVIYVHGGRWSGGAKEDGLPVVEALARDGYFAVTVNYRLAGEARYPAAVHDVKAAVRFLGAGAEELGIDPRRIGLFGEAAGGHLAALLATTGNEPALEGRVGTPAAGGADSAVQCAVDVSGPPDLDPALYRPPGPAIIAAWLGPADPAHLRARAREASPLTHVDGDDPPLLIVHGTADPLVPFELARIFHTRLVEAGVDAELLAVEGGGHHLDPSGYLSRVAEFFDRHLGGRAGRAGDR